MIEEDLEIKIRFSKQLKNGKLKLTKKSLREHKTEYRQMVCDLLNA